MKTLYAIIDLALFNQITKKNDKIPTRSLRYRAYGFSCLFPYLRWELLSFNIKRWTWMVIGIFLFNEIQLN